MHYYIVISGVGGYVTNNSPISGVGGYVTNNPPISGVGGYVTNNPPSQVLEGMVQDQEVMLDPRTDTWMFGVMLLHMFSPEPPYSQVRVL